mgnify:CR=1 FL=1
MSFDLGHHWRAGSRFLFYTGWPRTDAAGKRVAAGTTIVLDNLSVHRSADVRQLVAAAGCHLRFLPAYSPDFNPIELTFSRLKTHLRAAGKRTFDEVVDEIGASCGVTP